jgi:hypothetical protein
MSVLDQDLRDRQTRYQWFVDNAYTIEAEVEQWARAHGVDWHLHWRNHVYYRFFEEPERWHTLRYALEDREPGSQPPPSPPSPPPIERPPDPPRPAPGPSGPVLNRVVRVTNESDGELVNRQYSYYPSAVILGGQIYVFVGHRDGHPRFFRVSREGNVARLGPLLPYTGEAEGWYWNDLGWIYLTDGPRLRCVNPFTGEDRVVFSIEDTHPGCQLWQAHSSDDGGTHSATVQRIVSDGAYPRIGTVVFRYGHLTYYGANGTLDESALTPDGEFLVIKENDDNIIVNLINGEARIIPDAEGAVGHSDCGPGILVGEFSHGDHGECILWNLREPLTMDRRRVLFHTWNMGHVSIRGGVCLLSDRNALSIVSLTGGGVSPFHQHGMTVADANRAYDFQVRANLDPSGRVACFISNRAGRFDVYLAPVPR